MEEEEEEEEVGGVESACDGSSHDAEDVDFPLNGEEESELEKERSRVNDTGLYQVMHESRVPDLNGSYKNMV